MKYGYLDKLNKILEKSMPLVTFSGLILGYFAGKRVASLEFIVVPLFAFVTFTSTLNIKAREFISTIRKPKYLIAFFILFLFIQPVIAWAISSLFFKSDPEIITGIVLLYSTPIAITSSIWTDIYKGNMSLTITFILIGCIIAPFTTPFIIMLLLGNIVEINTAEMLTSLIWMIVIPSILGILTNELSKGRIPAKISPACKPFSKIGLFLVVFINAAAIRSSVNSFDIAYLHAGILAVFLSTVGFLAGFAVSKLLKADKGSIVSFTFSSGMRNISAALVLSITYFSPRASIPVVIGILFQQTLSAVIGSALFGRKKKNKNARLTKNT